MMKIFCSLKCISILLLSTLVIATIVFLTISFPDSASATSIAAIRTPTNIVIAADSKLNHDAQTASSPESICKIRRIGKIVVVADGLAYYTPTKFDLFSLISESIRNSKTVVDAITALDRIITGPLEITAGYLKQNWPTFYQHRFIEHEAVGVIFAEIEKDTLVFYSRDYIIDTSVGNEIKIKTLPFDCPGSGCKNGFSAILMAKKGRREEFQRNNPFYMDSDYVDITRRFVQMEIDANPDEVGPPIDIIRITKNGIQWIQRKPECPEIQDPK